MWVNTPKYKPTLAEREAFAFEMEMRRKGGNKFLQMQQAIIEEKHRNDILSGFNGQKPRRSSSATLQRPKVIIDGVESSRPSSAYSNRVIPFPQRYLRASSELSMRRAASPDMYYTSRSSSSIFSSKSFSSIRMPETNGSVMAKKRVKERKNVLPVHTCNVFPDPKRKRIQVGQCKRCSMMHDGKFASTSTHSPMASNLNGTLAKTIKRQNSPPKKAKRKPKPSKEEIEQDEYIERQIRQQRLANNIKSILKLYSSDVDKQLKRISRNEGFTAVQPTEYELLATSNDYPGTVTENFPDLYDDEQIMSLMREYRIKL